MEQQNGRLRRQRTDEGRLIAKMGYSRLELIANVEGFGRIDLCPFAGPEVDCRSRFLDPFLGTYQDRIKEREYFESIKRLDCAAKSTAETSVSFSFPR